ncbi:dockerin-like protein [Spirosoma sp. 209]|uniref:alpha/beta hydrolase family protein n=1 Tax=Spirosoma sp. 209 TaxID=1955701 RepID=UPI00098D449C|nr:dockerin-like protein [Spirosoma sp. 209]
MNRKPFSLFASVSAALAMSLAISCSDHIPARDYSIPPMPAYASLTSNPKLPDPFLFMNGMRMTSKDEWKYRRAELAALAQEFEYGYKPNTPSSAVTGSFADNRVTVSVTDNGKTISFVCSITYPTTGSKPYPAIVGIGGSNLNNTALLNMGVAIITFPNNQVAQQTNGSSRGKGLFFDMYGSDHSASATMAWAWGVSRLIDALEKTPAANIDPARLGVTGCSRNGKGALTVGAFDERIKLTIPQEPGAGGAASWRISDAQLAGGKTVQTLSQIVNENVWFRQSFSQFSKTSDKLPFDQHSVLALCAPRALLVIENTSIDWLSPVSSWNTAHAAHKVWQALGIPDRMGFSQIGGHNHCALPDSQLPELRAYVEKFLIGTGTGNTSIMRTDGGFTVDESTWIDWTVPSLN